MNDPIDSEVIDLEPTMTLQLAHPGLLGGMEPPLARPAGSAGIGLVQGSSRACPARLHDLKRLRIRAAAVAFAAIFGLLLVWVYVSDNPGTNTVEGSRFSVRLFLLAARCLLAVSVAGCCPVRRC